MFFPFKQSPKHEIEIIGNTASGTFEIISMDDLSIGEEELYSQLCEALPSETKDVMELIFKVCKDQNINFTEAQSAILGTEVEESKITISKEQLEEIRSYYVEDLMQINKKLNLIKFKKNVIAAFVMLPRVIEPLETYLAENEVVDDDLQVYEKQIKSLKTCTLEQMTDELSKATIQVLADFFEKENNGGKPPTDQTKEVKSVNDWGKQEAIEVPIGENSNTESDTYGLQISDSNQETTEIALVS